MNSFNLLWPAYEDEYESDRSCVLDRLYYLLHDQNCE